MNFNKKILPFLIIALISSFYIGFQITVLSEFKLNISDYSSYIKDYIPIILATLIFVIFYGYTSVFLEDKNLKIVFALTSTILFILGFLFGFNFNVNSVFFPLLITFLLIMLSLMIFNHRTYISYNNQINPDIGYTISSSSKDFIFILSLALAVTIYFNYSKPENYDLLKTNIVNSITDSTIGIVESSIKNELNSLLSKEIDIDANPNKAVKEGILSKISPTLAENLQLNLFNTNLKISPKDLLGDKINADNIDLKSKIRPIIEKRIDALIAPYQKYFPIIASLFSFFILSTAFFVLKFLLYPVSRLLIEILIKTGYLKEIEITLPAKRITL